MTCLGCSLKGQCSGILHYITFFTTLLTPEVTSGSSTKSYSSFIGVAGELKQVSFQLIFKVVSVFVSSWRLDGREFQAFGPAYEKLRSPNLSSVVGFHIENCWRNGVSDDRVDRRWLSSCRPGRQDCDQCAPGA